MSKHKNLSTREAWRSPAFWMAALMTLVQAAYAFQAYWDPGAFAEYRGTPLSASADAVWVQTYSSRTLFVSLIIGLLLLRRDHVTLKWVALAGVVMPASDALLAHQSGAANAIVFRHVATVFYLLITFAFLLRWSRKRT